MTTTSKFYRSGVLLGIALIVIAAAAAFNYQVAYAAVCTTSQGETNNSSSTACTTGGVANTWTGYTTSTGFTIADNGSTLGDIRYTCTLSSSDDDWYAIPVVSGDFGTLGMTLTASLNVTNSSASDNLTDTGTIKWTTSQDFGQRNQVNIDIYDQDGTTVLASNSANASNKSISADITSAGTYYVRISVDTVTVDSSCETHFEFGVFPLSSPTTVVFGGNQHSWTYNLQTSGTQTNVTVLPDALEDNDTIGTAFLIASPNSYSNNALTITSTDDDWLKFNKSSAFDYNIRAAASFGMSVSLTLYENCSLANPIATATGTNPIITGSVYTTSLASYCLRVQYVSGATEAPYLLDFDLDDITTYAEDNYEQNDSFATAATISGVTAGSTVSLTDVTISGAGDPDYFQFFADVGSSVTVSVFGINPNINYTIRLYKATDTGTALNSNGPFVNPTFTETTLPETGYYFLEIIPGGTTGQTGPYRLDVSLTAPPAAPADCCEVNDSFGTAFTIASNSTNSAAMYPIQNPDWYRFNLTSPSTVDITISNNAPVTTTYTITLYGPDGLAVPGGTATGANPTFSLPLTTTGNYWINVAETQGITSSGTYDLTVASTTITSGSLIADSCEQNDSQVSACAITLPYSNTQLNFVPANDTDWYSFQATAGQSYDFSMFSSNNVSAIVTLRDNLNAVIATGTGVSVSLGTITFPTTGVYTLEIDPQSAVDTAQYTLLIALPPTPVPTGTLPGTATGVPTPTLTPTPDQGGDPDIAESNNNFNDAFRIAAGNTISLNFFSGTFGIEDIDYFQMNVKTGIVYTCFTENLGVGTDTILSVFGPSPSTSALLGINDDIDTQAGLINSRVTWTSEYDGEAFVVVAQNGRVSLPGAATYDLTCVTGTGVETEDGGSGGSGGTSSQNAGAANIELIGVPTVLPTATHSPVEAFTIRLLVAYDENDNGIIDVSEGVANMSVRVINTITNRQLAQGFTDDFGFLQLTVTAPTDEDLLVVIPFLYEGRRFNTGQIADWHLLIPATNLPGIIP